MSKMKNDYLSSAFLTPHINNSTTSASAATTITAAAAAINESTNEEHSKLTIAVLGVLYSLIFLIGITGNSLGKKYLKH